MFCQNVLLFKFVFSIGNRDDDFGKISVTIEATDNILVLVVKWPIRGRVNRSSSQSLRNPCQAEAPQLEFLVYCFSWREKVIARSSLRSRRSKGTVDPFTSTT